MNKRSLEDFDQMIPFDNKENLERNRYFPRTSQKNLCSRLSHKEFHLITFEEAIEKVIQRESAYLKSSKYLQEDDYITPSMRAVLIEWLAEVSDLFKLNTETFDLSICYLDHYASSNSFIEKKHFQSIGITCLFVASKYNEVSHPKIDEFAILTDGACNTEKILYFERLIIKSLDWRLSAYSFSSIIYTILASHSVNKNKRHRVSKLLTNRIPVDQFKKIYKLINFCILDRKSLNYSNLCLSVCACQLILHYELSFYKDNSVYQCLNWMNPYYMVLKSVNCFHENKEDDFLNDFNFVFKKDHDYLKLMPYVENYISENTIHSSHLSTFTLTPP